MFPLQDNVVAPLHVAFKGLEKYARLVISLMVKPKVCHIAFIMGFFLSGRELVLRLVSRKSMKIQDISFIYWCLWFCQ